MTMLKRPGKLLASAVLLPCTSASGRSAQAQDVEYQYLEPVVQRHVGVLPPSVCKQLIDLGEKFGFLVEKESIDVEEQHDPNEKFIPSQTIDVYVKGWTEPDLPPPKEGHTVVIDNEAIWNLLQPVVPTITEIVKVNRDREAFSELYPDNPDKEPELNWVFFRKYSPTEKRNSLKHHVDTNMNTVNIELNDDYKGGGLFYIKPSASTGGIADEYYSGGYRWIESVKRLNTSDIVFPDLHTGDAIFYNYTVRHGVAPVESGTRYSMAFFFDMDNPALYDSQDDSDDGDFFKDESENEDAFKVEFHNGLPDVELDFVLVHDGAHESEVWEIMSERVKPGETTNYRAYEGDRIWSLIAGTDEAVSDIEIRRDQSLYEVSEIEPLMSSEL